MRRFYLQVLKEYFTSKTRVFFRCPGNASIQCLPDVKSLSSVDSVLDKFTFSFTEPKGIQFVSSEAQISLTMSFFAAKSTGATSGLLIACEFSRHFLDKFVSFSGIFSLIAFSEFVFWLHWGSKDSGPDNSGNSVNSQWRSLKNLKTKRRECVY